MKSRTTTKYLYLSSLLITATSLFIGSNQPVNSAPIGSDSKPTVVAKTTSKPKYKAPGAAPEAGVQLLMGILHRIGNEPQVAMQKNNQSKLDEVGAKTAFLANGVDPAFVIRPQQQLAQARRERSSLAGKTAPQTQSEQLLAMLPKKQELQRASADKDTANYKGSYSSDEIGQLSGALNAPVNAGMTTRQKSMDRASSPNLEKSINKLYSITKFVEEITANKNSSAPIDASAASEEMQAAIGDSESRVIRTGSRSVGNRISQVPRIDEFSGGRAMSSQGYAQPMIADARKAGFYSASHANSTEQDDAKSLDAPGGATYMKPENPTSFRSIKEYGMPTTPEPLPELKKAKPSAAAFGGGGGVAVAYIPPQLVAGIPGLRLGVPESSVESYVKGKGSVYRQQVNGWKVISVNSSSTGKTTLQIYMRNGTVQAFRIFDPEFVPDGLGVNLHGKLSTMKKKFGQQQFILDEPSSNESEGKGARNYVYPVNQISFQLARSTPKDQPTVQSLLLFQFL